MLLLFALSHPLQCLPVIGEPADYEEVEFGVPAAAGAAPQNTAAFYDVLRRDWDQLEDDTAIYEVPSES